jgi:hypothetical protein
MSKTNEEVQKQFSNDLKEAAMDIERLSDRLEGGLDSEEVEDLKNEFQGVCRKLTELSKIASDTDADATAPYGIGTDATENGGSKEDEAALNRE